MRFCCFSYGCCSLVFGSLSLRFGVRNRFPVTIRNELPYNSTIYLSMQAYYYGRTATIRDRTDVCSYSNLGFIGNDGSFYQSTEGNSLCPLRSDVPYLLLTSFTVQQLPRDANLEFTPDLIMWFYATPEDYDTSGSSSSRIGCVETGTLAQVALNQRRSTRGAVALIVSIFCFVTTFGLCLHGFSGRRRRDEAGWSEPNRLASMVRHYRYRRTNRSGSVSLTPSLRKGRSVGSGSQSGGPTSSTGTGIVTGTIVVPRPPLVPARTKTASLLPSTSRDSDYDSIAITRSIDGNHTCLSASGGDSSTGLLVVREPAQPSLSNVI
jgi:hypothetical protein